jgi:hypothetical protein
MDKELVDEKGRPVVFYYSREERLKRASPAVRKLNEPSVFRKPNLFRTLTSTKPLTFLFISIITLCAALVILSRFMPSGTARTLGGSRVTVTARTGSGVSYITVTKTVLDEGAYAGAVDIAVSPAAEKTGGAEKSAGGTANSGAAEAVPPDSGTAVSGEFPIEALRVYFTAEPEEAFRFTVPFTGKKLLVLMEAGAGRVLFSVTPDL